MSISELCISEIFSNEAYLTDFVKIEKYKYLRVAGYSDTCIYIELQFSHDCETVGITKSLYLNGKNWVSESHIEPLLPYVRIRLQKADIQFPGTNLIIHVTGRFSDNLKSVAITQPPAKAESSSSGSKRSSFLSSLKKKDKEPSEPISLMDYRLPSVLLKGSLLYVAGTNRIESIPQGMPGDILMLNHDGKPFWSAT